MLEREMEDLIANYPNHFFPRHDFVLKGRQQSFRGVGRFDLLFTDRYGMDVLMELKAVPAKYEVIDQIARYRDALVGLGSTRIIMWLVAPTIPRSMCEFLSHLGIEYTEIHSTEFNRVAKLNGYQMREADQSREAVTEVVPASHMEKPEARTTDNDCGTDSWGYGVGTQNSFLLNALENGGKTKEQIRSEFIAHFWPELSISDGRSKSSFSVCLSDSKRPIGTYHGSRSLLIKEDEGGRLSLDEQRCRVVKAAIAGGILGKTRGLHFKRDKEMLDAILADFGLPSEAK